MFLKKRELIKFLKCIKHILLMYVISFIVLGVITYFVINVAQNLTTKFDIAVVNKDDSPLSDMCFNIVSKQKISDNILSFENISSDKANDGLKDGKYAIVLTLPEGCINSIRSGQKTNFILYVNEKYELIYKLIKSISENFAKMLIAGQYGVFAGEEVITNNINNFSNLDFEDFYNKYIMSSNLNLISIALSGKNTIFKNTTLSYGKSNVGLFGFYFISFIIFVLVVGNIGLYGFYKDDYYDQLISRLKFYKITANEFFIGKIILPILIELIFVIILFLIFKIEFSILFIFSLIVGFVLINIWTLFCAFLVKNKYNYIIYLLVIVALCTFLNGGILPRAMMPQKILEFMSYTPYGVCFSLCASFTNGIFDIKMIILAFIYILLPYVILTRLKFENN